MAYIHHADVTKDKVEQPPLKVVSLFGNDYKVYDDSWRNHLHVVPTYKCNAKCSFCIEKNSKCEETNLLGHFNLILNEMQKAGILHTVSFTGGEPAINWDLEDLVYAVPRGIFKTINTNGFDLSRTARMGFNAINLSRHHIDDEKNMEVFGCHVPTIDEIRQMQFYNSQLRLQAVVNEDTRIEDYLKLIEEGVCYDVSFRSLMINGTEEAHRNHAMYLKLIDDALAMRSKVLEQELQDYYVYEVHDIDGKLITFSYSNMEMVLEEDAADDDSSFIREFILRPDGSLSGSWAEGKKIIPTGR